MSMLNLPTNLQNIFDKLETSGDKIRFLKGVLSSSESPLADWRMTKIYEARLMGEEDPYDLEQLIADRKAIRAKIGELEEEEED